jgi:hypothetical protein
MALWLNREGGIARPTWVGFGHPAILGYLRSLGKHNHHRDHEDGGIHCLTNDEASMLDSIYPGAETHLITDHDNDSIKGIHTSATSPPTLGRGSPIKSCMLRVKIHEHVWRQLISLEASKAKGHGHLNLSEPPSYIITNRVRPRVYDMIHQNLSHLIVNSSLWLPLLRP